MKTPMKSKDKPETLDHIGYIFLLMAGCCINEILPISLSVI